MQAAHKKNTNHTHPLNPTSTAFYPQLQLHHQKLLTILSQSEMIPQQEEEPYMVYTNVEVICIHLIAQSCYVRYEHSGDLLGKLDTGVRYKKCSKGVSSDVEFFRRRDDVLEDLQTANGFRVSSSGLVQGFAQCLGHLSVSDCSTCLVDAVGKMKSLCGSAAAVDVFLGQCYARYWASGYYDERDTEEWNLSGLIIPDSK
ncbi:variant 4, Plasmodesmata-located protein 8 [Lathyrus oleraceus]|uniref:Variant 4, Plasmodesmata-located protein 8 n=1 Tax=Pisum sativum TaxID=3888 RepID=A0A9D4Y1R5_PEA|nr:variant 4, Plasmodesmata-located protein 8 [Pisum sativum]